MDKYCLHLSLPMLIECIWLHNKPYEMFEGNIIWFLGLQGKLVKRSIGWFFVFTSLKCCSLKCRPHVQKKSFKKNSNYSYKYIETFSNFWVWTKEYIHIDVHMWKIIITKWIILVWTIFKNSLKFVLCKCYL